MKDSALIVFLPLVGTILGAVVGAVGGAWANGWYRDREAKKAEDREREGLMRLISAEVEVNRAVFDQRKNHASIAKHLNTAIWEGTRARLAQLLSTDEIMTLVIYYATIQYIGVHWAVGNDEKPRPDKQHSSDEQHKKRAKTLTCTIRTVARKYIKDDSFFVELGKAVAETQEGSAEPSST